MCGIAGILDIRDGMWLADGIRAMTDAMAYRGPDDMGFLMWDGQGTSRSRHPVSQPHTRLALGHRRLSIIDLTEGGHQPMTSRDGLGHLIFNGELYNYRELRRELETAGRFTVSQSDSEVLLEACRLWGDSAWIRFRGMFAFALLDEQTKTLCLVRDPFGIKPLYYAAAESRFAFASEIGPLLNLPWMERTLNPQRAYDYLRFGLTDHGEETLFQGIRQVPPGHVLRIDCRTAAFSEPEPFFSLDSIDKIEDLSYSDAVDGIREAFLDSVRLHLRSDVPVGVALSGGIDSSAIVGAIRHLEPDMPLRTVVFVSPEKGTNEREHAMTVARASSAEVCEVQADPARFIADIEALITLQGEPFGSCSIYAQHLVFRAARECGITVMIDGQGADELFSGYPAYRGAYLAELLRRHAWKDAACFLVGAWGRYGDNLASLLGNSALRLYFPQRLQDMVRRLGGHDLCPPWMNREWMASSSVLVGSDWLMQGDNILRCQLRRSLERGLRQLLRYEDRNSMHVSIESRLPFLDPVFAGIATRLPARFLMGSDGNTKQILRDAVRGLVPESILARRDKIGFAMPERAWSEAVRPWMDRILRSLAPGEMPVFDQKKLLVVWNRFARKASIPFTVWRWVNFILWARAMSVTFR